MKERPILVAVIGYIIGILWGLYFTFSIVLCYIPTLATYYFIQRNFMLKREKRKCKILSVRRYYRYLKLIVDKKAIFILILFSILSNSIVLFQNKNYEKAYQDGETIKIEAVVISEKIEKQYYNLYQVKVLHSKNFNLYLQVNKKIEDLEYGDKLQLQGDFKKPSKQRNYGGYDEEQYLKTIRTIGRMKVNTLKIIGKRQLNCVSLLANDVKNQVKGKIENNFEEEKASLLKGLLLGDTDHIPKEVKEDFRTLNISHILAISGMHISYMIMGMTILLKKIVGKRKTKILTVFILIFYVFITGFSASVVRAVVMGVVMLVGEIICRKSDRWNSLAISLLGILFYNPFLLLNVGLQLSYIGTIGIILFYASFLKVFNQKERFPKIKEIVALSLSVQITVLPVSLYYFNTMGIYFLPTNLIVSIIIGPIILLGFFSVISKLFVIPVSVGLDGLNLMTQFSKLPFSKIYFPTPSVVGICLYFIVIVVVKQLYWIYHKEKLTETEKRIKNMIALFRYRFRQKKKKYVRLIFSILVVIIVIHTFPKDLKIHFVDVGQGDCTFMVTPKNKTILMDGGGSLSEDFDIGERTLIPYLLDRGYTSIDYILVSHADQDHIRTAYLVYWKN